MRRFVFWIFGVPAALVLIAFALANRKAVTISFDPLSPDAPWFALELPAWVLLFAGIFIGLVTGWIAAWIGQGKWRKAARDANSELVNERSTRQAMEKDIKAGLIAPRGPIAN